ncbi:HAD family hydrolase [Aurantibacter crassamenti]|uniref:HAD hydrolase-like protein n=1 Tax=Aurantibacter crassamenti TaxID=1837375 RepID=UPI001939F79C|nr:HAD hydrolase-like protein [Aurantibacter crassamenti]MBM1107166.1 HAD family hydrolase [Aurantibacter crassamenti]
MGIEKLNEIESDKAIQTIFVDFFDTLVHRTVHPNQVIRLWAKLMIRELGLSLKIDELYFIRKEAAQYLSKKYGRPYFEVNYDELIYEVYNRLTATSTLNSISFLNFTSYFELAEIRAEFNVQYLNQNTTNSLKTYKEKGYKLYCVSDFYTSSSIIEKLLEKHQIAELFEAVFVSADYRKSKYSGNLYASVLEDLGIATSSAVMIGDNLKSDVHNAKANGLIAIHIPNKRESKTKKRYLLGSDRKDYSHVLKKLYKTCNANNAPANSDYVLFYAIYIERLYHHLKKNGIKNILFLAREGLYLKKLFDQYQQHFALKEEDKIKTHYFKTSRQASMLVALKDVEEEKYTFLRRKYPNLSLNSFLRNFTFNEEVISLIIDEMNLQARKNEVIADFLESEIYKKLKTNETFKAAYDKNRFGQQNAFKKYLDSFGVNFHEEGMHLADIGWGGSMQECLFDYFDKKVEVHGHYLGLNEVYDIKKETTRWGLNFSIFPYKTYYDNILRGNTELNEQLLSAGHGSTLSYNHLDTFTNEFHHEVEKKVFYELISEVQEFMFKQFTELLNDLDSVCYDDAIVQKEMTDYALRAGLFASKKKIASAMKISEGFYTNVGDFSNGLKISPKKYTQNKLGLLKTFVLSPDELFPLILRIKPYLYSRKKYFLVYLLPSWLIYVYIKVNRSIKTNVFQKISRFKYAYLK